MIATGAVRALVRKGDDHQLRSQISVGRADGMMTTEQSLADLVRLGRITRETALAHGAALVFSCLKGTGWPLPGPPESLGINRPKNSPDGGKWAYIGW